MEAWVPAHIYSDVKVAEARGDDPGTSLFCTYAKQHSARASSSTQKPQQTITETLPHATPLPLQLSPFPFPLSAMAPNTSKSDECNNNHLVHKTDTAVCAKATATRRPSPVVPAPATPAPSAPYFCCKGRQFHLYSGLMRHIKVSAWGSSK